MQTINLHDLKNYNTKLISEYLGQHNDNNYEIIIPWDPLDKEDLNFSIFWEYYTAAFAGQKLFDISESFAYYVPCPNTKNAFRFELKIPDRKKLTLTLRFIIIGYYTDGEAMTRFHDEASKYFEESFNAKIESATWGLLHIANKYLGKSP